MIQNLMSGMTAETLPSGIRFVRLHYSADPLKTPEWAERERAKEADPRNWDTQMEMRRVVTDGLPVFSGYNDQRHCPSAGWNLPFEVTSMSSFFGGWDAGMTLNPAFILLELQQPMMRVRVLLEVVSTGGESMDAFAPRVAHALDQFYPSLASSVRHFGDPTIETRSGGDGGTARQVARKYGFDIEPSTNEWTKRSSAVAFLLRSEGLFEVNGFLCPVLRRGFQGQYKFQSSPLGDSSGPGQVLLSPLKNSYSHVQDALQYPSVFLYDLLKPGGGAWSSDAGFLERLRDR